LDLAPQLGRAGAGGVEVGGLRLGRQLQRLVEHAFDLLPVFERDAGHSGSRRRDGAAGTLPGWGGRQAASKIRISGAATYGEAPGNRKPIHDMDGACAFRTDGPIFTLPPAASGPMFAP